MPAQSLGTIFSYLWVDVVAICRTHQCFFLLELLLLCQKPFRIFFKKGNYHFQRKETHSFSFSTSGASSICSFRILLIFDKTVIKLPAAAFTALSSSFAFHHTTMHGLTERQWLKDTSRRNSSVPINSSARKKKTHSVRGRNATKGYRGIAVFRSALGQGEMLLVEMILSERKKKKKMPWFWETKKRSVFSNNAQ